MTSPAPSSMARSTQVLSIKMSAKRLPPATIAAVNRAVQGLLGFDRFNEIYSRLPPCEPYDFSRTFLEAMQVRVEWTGQPIETIPTAGPLITIANHPFGLIEGMALGALLGSRRPDVTTMATHLLAGIPEYRDLILVDPERKGRRRMQNVRGWLRSFEWLAKGGALTLFPAGRVARFQWRRGSIADEPWSAHVAMLARRSQAPVLPVYFHGHNGFAFQLAGMLYPPLQELLLVGEVVNKRGRTLHATIGRLIEPSELSAFATNQKAIDFLRQETERLAR